MQTATKQKIVKNLAISSYMVHSIILKKSKYKQSFEATKLKKKTSKNIREQDCCILKKGKTSACKETCTYKVQKLSPVVNSFKMDGGQVENSCGLTNQKFKSFLEIFTNCILPAKEEGNSQTWLFTRKPQTTFCIYCKPTALHESPRWLSPDLSPFDGQRKIVK